VVSTTPARVVRYSLEGERLPPSTETIVVAELVRRTAQGIYGRLFHGASSPILSGKNPDGSPLEGHRHAFYLPADEDGDGLLDHLTVTAAAGFDPEREMVALEELHRLRFPGFPPITLRPLGRGQPADFPHCPLLARATHWRSITPFVPTRHYKRRGRKRDTGTIHEFLARVLREELDRRGLPQPTAVRVIRHRQLSASDTTPPFLPWSAFRQERLTGGGRRGRHPGVGFRIEFPEPVRGPLALGYACHFGLGLFEADNPR